MNREKAFQALNALDDRYIAEALRYAPEGAAGASERSASMRSKRIVTLALAAALVGWGGVSVQFQTLAVLADSKTKTSLHLAGRFMSAVFGAALAYGMGRIFL